MLALPLPPIQATEEPRAHHRRHCTPPIAALRTPRRPRLFTPATPHCPRRRLVCHVVAQQQCGELSRYRPHRGLDAPWHALTSPQSGDTSRRPASAMPRCSCRAAGCATPRRCPLRVTSTRTRSSGSSRMACASTSCRQRPPVCVSLCPGCDAR
jgi:hypothetical protein